MELVYYVGGVGGSGGGKIVVGVGGWLVRVPECTLAPLLMRIMFDIRETLALFKFEKLLRV